MRRREWRILRRTVENIEESRQGDCMHGTGTVLHNRIGGLPLYCGQCGAAATQGAIRLHRMGDVPVRLLGLLGDSTAKCHAAESDQSCRSHEIVCGPAAHEYQ